jgi:hypothetical protein
MKFRIKHPNVSAAVHEAAHAIVQGTSHAAGVVSHSAQHAGRVAAQVSHHAAGVTTHGVHHASGVVAKAAHHARGVAAKAAHHAGGVAAKAAHHAGGVAAKAAHHAGSVAAHGVHHAGGVVATAGHHAGGMAAQVVHHAGGVISQEVQDEVTRKIVRKFEEILDLRHLSGQERDMAYPVFRDTVPYDRILLSPLQGLRPFTVPGNFLFSSAATAGAILGPLLGALAAAVCVPACLAILLADLWDKYIVFYGRDGYKHGFHPYDGASHHYETLMHEMTHVWQGEHAGARGQWHYVLQACRHNTNYRTLQTNESFYNPFPIYRYNKHPQFRDFTVEQMAMVVQYSFDYLYDDMKTGFAPRTPGRNRANSRDSDAKFVREHFARFIKGNIWTRDWNARS